MTTLKEIETRRRFYVENEKAFNLSEIGERYNNDIEKNFRKDRNRKDKKISSKDIPMTAGLYISQALQDRLKEELIKKGCSQ